MPKFFLLFVFALVLAGCAHHPAQPKTAAYPYGSGGRSLPLPPEEGEGVAGIASPSELGYEVNHARPGSSRRTYNAPEPGYETYYYNRKSTKPSGRHSGDGSFPRFPELEPAIAFWQHTYAVWGRSQVAIHDDRHMGVVYEVVDLPGEVGDSMTPEQRQWVAERREYWRSRLLALEDRISAGGRLDGGDQQLASILESGGGVRAVLPGASERVRSQRGMRERFMRGLQIGARYESTYRKIFRDAGLPEDLAYLPHVESSFQFAAHSSAGAVGVWQFTRAGAQNYLTVNSRVDERLDPIASTYGAARYLGDAYAKLGDWPTTLTSYNHGVNGMVRAQGQMGNDFIRIVKHYNSPAFGFAGRNYYAEFLAARDIARNPQQYFAQAGDYGLSD